MACHPTNNLGIALFATIQANKHRTRKRDVQNAQAEAKENRRNYLMVKSQHDLARDTQLLDRHIAVSATKECASATKECRRLVAGM